MANLIALPRPLKPFANQIFVVTIRIRSVDESASKVVDLVKNLEALLVCFSVTIENR